MATLIQFRSGASASVPALSIGEPGLDVDTKTMRLGDGTASPPRIPTTKSSGSFDFSSTSYFALARLLMVTGQATQPSIYFNASDGNSGFYSPGVGQAAYSAGGVNIVTWSSTGENINGNIAITGTVDTVKIASLNPIGTNGIIVKTNTNAYAFRNLVSGHGMAPMLDGSSNANAGGATGDIVIAIANNPTIPGNAAVKIPSGTTGDSAGVSPVDGHLRYDLTQKAFVGRIDGQWRSLVDYVEGHVVNVPADFVSIQDAIDYYKNRSTKSSVSIQLAAGAFTVDATLEPGSSTNNIQIFGQPPIQVPLDSTTPVMAVSGSAGNWSVQYKLNGSIPAGLTTDYSIIIDQIHGSGDEPFFEFVDNSFFVSVPGGNLNQVTTQAGVNISNWYAANDYIMLAMYDWGPDVRKVTSILNSTTLTVDANWPETGGGTFYHRKLAALTGTLSAAGTAVSGSGTSFTTQVNVGDFIYLYASKQIIKVASITNNTSLVATQAVTTYTDTTNIPITTGSEVGLLITNTSSHKGCWHISALDTLNNTITVINTSQSSTPPIKHGIRAATITFLTSTILYTSNWMSHVGANEHLGFTNLTVRYTGSNPTSSFAMVVDNGSANLGYNPIIQENPYIGNTTFGYLGIIGGGVVISNNSGGYYGRLAISGGPNGIWALALATSSDISGIELIINGNANGLSVAQSNIHISKVLTCCGNASAGLTIYDGSSLASSLGISSYNNGSYGVLCTRLGSIDTAWIDARSNNIVNIEADTIATIEASNYALLLGAISPNANPKYEGLGALAANQGGITLSTVLSGANDGGGLLANVNASITTYAPSLVNNGYNGAAAWSGSTLVILNHVYAVGNVRDIIHGIGNSYLQVAVNAAYLTPPTAGKLRVASGFFDIGVLQNSDCAVGQGVGGSVSTTSATIGATLSVNIPVNTATPAANGCFIIVS